jgi:hypothetical protein
VRNQASKAEKGSHWRDNVARNVRLAGFAGDAGLAEAAAPERFEQAEVAPAPSASNSTQPDRLARRGMTDIEAFQADRGHSRASYH